MLRITHIVSDSKGELSLARLGLILTTIIAVITIAIDISLSITGHGRVLPNSVYALESTMFMTFVSWVTGPRMVASFAPQIGAAASALAQAARDVRLPSRQDDETHGGK